MPFISFGIARYALIVFQVSLVFLIAFDTRALGVAAKGYWPKQATGGVLAAAVSVVLLASRV